MLDLTQIRAEKRRRELARDIDGVRKRCERLTGFIREAWHVPEPTARYVHNWHIDAIAEHLEAVHLGQIKRLQINQPPGTMKSLTVSVMFPAWEWGPGQMPGLRFFTTSYREDYARRDSRKHRDLIISDWYRTLYPEIELTIDGEANFENTFKGNRNAVPFMSLTGGRGNRLIIDDPLSTQQAESDTELKKAERIFTESATSRLNDPERDAIIVMMQRLHPEDTCGIIDKLGLPYTKLILPMEYIRSVAVTTPFFTDPRTEDGELLFPERVSRETVEQNKTELGPHAYDTQFQQLPRQREGTTFFTQENLLVDGEPVDMPTRCDAVFAIVDTAMKAGKKHDGAGVTYFAYTKFPVQRAVILDWDIQQITGAATEAWIPSVFTRLAELAQTCGARMGSLGAWIEDKQSGTILLQKAPQMGWPAQAIDSKLTAQGKDGRGLNVSGYVYTGKVKISRPAFDKTTAYKGNTRNHFLWQVLGFRIGVGTPNDEDDLFDTFCYGVAIALGDSSGL